MLDPRPVLRIVGWILCLLAAAMVLSALADAGAGDREWRAFAVLSGLTLFVGLALELGSQAPWSGLDRRQTYLACVLGWIVPGLFSALPFLFGASHLSVCDAVFEATAGLTTTAATALADPVHLPPGLLLWRGLLQWLGGIGALGMAVAVLPGLKVGGLQVFRIELMAPDNHPSPRAIRTVLALAGAYGGLTVVLAAALWLAGTPGFDSWMDALATVSTGGFSARDAMGGDGRGLTGAILILGMAAAGLPVLALGRLGRAGGWAVFRDHQIRWYLGVMAVSALSMAAWLVVKEGNGVGVALAHGAFATVSALTGTGFTGPAHAGWTGMPAALVLFLVLLGGCSGSTTGGIKVFRLQLLLADAMVRIRELLRPHAVLPASFNRRPIERDILRAAMGFLVVYALALAAVAMGLGLTGLDFSAALSAAAGALANRGPVLDGGAMPVAAWAALPNGAKWLLDGAMLLGRVEMFPILVLCAPGFWER